MFGKCRSSFFAKINSMHRSIHCESKSVVCAVGIAFGMGYRFTQTPHHPPIPGTLHWIPHLTQVGSPSPNNPAKVHE